MQPQDASRNLYRNAAAVVAVAILIAGGTVVGISGVGIDVLAVGLLVVVLVLLDRTVGDWLAEASSSGVPNLLFAGLLAVAVSLLFLTSTGAGWMEKFLKFGEGRGYQGLWLKSRTAASGSPAQNGAAGVESASSPGVRSSGGAGNASARISFRPHISGRGSPRAAIQPGAASLGAPDSQPEAADAEYRNPDSPGTRPAAAPAGSRAASTYPDATDGLSSAGRTGLATATTVNVTPQSVRAGEHVAALAVVTRPGGQVRTGRVEFSVNGVVHSSASVGGDGTARVSLKAPAPGLFSIQARFTGSTGLLPSSSPAVHVAILPNE